MIQVEIGMRFSLVLYTEIFHRQLQKMASNIELNEILKWKDLKMYFVLKHSNNICFIFNLFYSVVSSLFWSIWLLTSQNSDYGLIFHRNKCIE